MRAVHMAAEAAAGPGLEFLVSTGRLHGFESLEEHPLAGRSRLCEPFFSCHPGEIAAPEARFPGLIP